MIKVANAQNQSDNMFITSINTTITTHQFEQLLRLLPTPSKGEDNEDEMDVHYSCMVSCYFYKNWCLDSWIWCIKSYDWIFSMSEHAVVGKDNSIINMPIGETSNITHTWNIFLESNIRLNNVLYIPAFKHNLLSVNNYVKIWNVRSHSLLSIFL